MAGALEGLALLVGDKEPGVAVLKRFLALPVAADSRHLLAALRGVLDDRRIDWLQQRLAEMEKTDFAPEPWVNGEDLIAAGLAPGPLFKRVLTEMYDAQLEGRLGSKQEAISKIGVRGKDLTALSPVFAQGTDDLMDVSDLGDAQAEIFADFDGFADADCFVVDQQFQGLIAAFEEFDDRSGAQAHNLGQGQLALGEAHDHRDLKAKDPLQFVLRRAGGCAFSFGVENGHRESSLLVKTHARRASAPGIIGI